MHKQKKKNPFWKKLLITLAILTVLLVATGFFLQLWVRIPDPTIADMSVTKKTVEQHNGYTSFENNYLRHSQSGLWEMYVEGSDFERGVATGKLTKDLLKYQEDAFIEQIRQIIPSDTYLGFLRVFIGLFNRKLPQNVLEEYQHEIYGISLSCTHEYDKIGTPYERQLNYHSAHDLGHAMQDYMLVGCTSFASWKNSSQDSTLIVGRNFDFYVGDKFAENKIVAFYNPDKGYKFATVTWAGMIGVLSGMNEAGLTVTINAAKSDMPTSSATPISILCREILQYASTIEEAYAIAHKRKTFVSESILIGSAKDNSTAIIEKSPNNIGLYTPSENWLVSANHFQSDIFKNDEKNKENIATSDSPYRQQRAEELIQQNMPLNPQKAAAILRNKEGLGNKNIGLGNEKAINQLICHHSVIFEPQKGIMWVSTSPWQIGKYVAYDLNQIFQHPDFSKEIIIDSLTIAEDLFLNSENFTQFCEYKTKNKELRNAIKNNIPLSASWIKQYVSTNPEMYYVYDLLGNYYLAQKDKKEAIAQWQKALEKEIPKLGERNDIQKKIEKAK